MEINLLLIGKNSFISCSIYRFLKKKIKIKKISYEEFNKTDKVYLSQFSHVCNCAIKKKYQKNEYLLENDIDANIIAKIKNIKLKYIFLSSRKVYSPSDNIKENSLLKPSCNYSRNKIITEKIVKKILPNKYLILRVSNIIGQKSIKSKNRKVSITFIDNFYKFKKKKKIFYKDFYKDFLSEEQFSSIFYKILKKNLKGTFNVSLGEKVFISEILFALNKNKKNNKFYKIDNACDDNFVLNNQKLKKKINIKIKKSDLLKYCYNM